MQPAAAATIEWNFRWIRYISIYLILCSRGSLILENKRKEDWNVCRCRRRCSSSSLLCLFIHSMNSCRGSRSLFVSYAKLIRDFVHWNWFLFSFFFFSSLKKPKYRGLNTSVSIFTREPKSLINLIFSKIYATEMCFNYRYLHVHRPHQPIIISIRRDKTFVPQLRSIDEALLNNAF